MILPQERQFGAAVWREWIVAAHAQGCMEGSDGSARLDVGWRRERAVMRALGAMAEERQPNILSGRFGEIRSKYQVDQVCGEKERDLFQQVLQTRQGEISGCIGWKNCSDEL